MSRFPKLGTKLSGDFRDSYNEGVDKVDAELTLQKQRVDDLIIGTPQPSEVVDARGGATVLRDRFDGVDSSLAEKATKTELNDIGVSQINKNKGKLDQTYMTDEFLQQMAGTTPINAVPADGSITQKKLAKPYLPAVKGKNLFDKSTVTDGKYINSGNGVLSTSATYSASDYILLIPNTTYKISGTNEQFALYDSSKNFTRGLTSTTSPLITTASECYVRLSMLTTQKDAVQIEVGSLATSYEPYNTYYFDETTIKNNISKEKLDKTLVYGVQSGNLFDKSMITDGKYVNAGNGVLSTNATFSASDYIAVEPNTQYCFANYTAGDQGAFYNSSKVYISGFTAKTITTPINAAYIRFGCLTTELPTQKFEKGTVSTPYEAYGFNFVGYANITNDAKNKLAKKPSNLIKVSQDGNCDYTSINAAVANTGDGNTIQIMGGVYNEIVKAFGKDLSIIGVDKKRCILKNTNGDYNTPPLEMTHGYLANMTIFSEKLSGATDPAKLSYAIHIDNSNCQGKTFLVENCDIISDWNSAVGIGLWNNYTLTFRNCNFYLHNLAQTNGAVLFHNSSVDGSTNQNIIFDNCRIIADGDVAIYALDALPSGSSPTKATFYDTLIYSKTKGKNGIITKTSGSAWSGNNITLTTDCFGNNLTELNL